MDVDAERGRRIEDALTRCATDLVGERLHFDAYEQWRSTLREPHSVPTALGIAGSKAEFAAVCAGFGITATGRKPRSSIDPPAEPFTPEPLTQRWDRPVVLDALRRCAADIEITPSTQAYESWRALHDNPDAFPPLRVITELGWAWQLKMAGLAVESHRRLDLEIWAHVRFVRDRLGMPVTRAEYDRFRTANPELHLVSASTLRVRTGKKWSQLFGPKVFREL